MLTCNPDYGLTKANTCKKRKPSVLTEEQIIERTKKNHAAKLKRPCANGRPRTKHGNCTKPPTVAQMKKFLSDENVRVGKLDKNELTETYNATLRNALIRFYAKNNADVDVDTIDTILHKYIDQHESLFSQLNRKYKEPISFDAPAKTKRISLDKPVKSPRTLTKPCKDGKERRNGISRCVNRLPRCLPNLGLTTRNKCRKPGLPQPYTDLADDVALPVIRSTPLVGSKRLPPVVAQIPKSPSRMTEEAHPKELERPCANGRPRNENGNCNKPPTIAQMKQFLSDENIRVGKLDKEHLTETYNTTLHNALTRFYTKHAPENLQNIDNILDKFKDQHERLFSKLLEKYKEPISDPATSKVSGAPLRSRRPSSINSSLLK